MLKSKGEKVFNVFNIILMCLLSLVFILPYWMILISSLTDELALIRNGYGLWTNDFSFEAYRYIFTTNPLMIRSILNSIFIAVVGAILTLVVSMLYAYPLSRRSTKGKRFFSVYSVITMLFGGGLIPTFLVVSTFFDDSLLAIIVPQAMSAWYAILLKNYYMSLPESLEEAARLDGAGHYTIMFRIYVPLSMPINASILLFTAVSLWNNYTSPMIYLTTKEKFPVQYLVQQIMTSLDSIYGGVSTGVTPSQSVKMASIVVASLPIIIVYPFLQKYFINGTIVGGVKE
ncbi:MAG TPA: carbohydrate ABC transporter permease [Candidatus Borkfalkia stercoripullorum]|nr:carbohydrate ABC transporter permease [Candidatus Borkfalkia stercoripullorum]